MKTLITLEQIASLVEEREIIDHGTIRCLRDYSGPYPDYDLREISSAEGIEIADVGTGTIGDDDLADEIRDLDGEDAIILRLAVESCNDVPYDTAEEIALPDEEDELSALEGAIDAIRGLVRRINRLDEDDMKHLQGYGLSVVSDTDEDWDTDSDGDPICRTTTTVTLLDADGDDMLEGEIDGYYCRCISCGDRYSEWQDSDGPTCDRIARIIGKVVDASDLAEYIDAPDEPDAPTITPLLPMSKCPTCGHDPQAIPKKAAKSRWSKLTPEERSKAMREIRRKGIERSKQTQKPAPPSCD